MENEHHNSELLKLITRIEAVLEESGTCVNCVREAQVIALTRTVIMTAQGKDDKEKGLIERIHKQMLAHRNQPDFRAAAFSDFEIEGHQPTEADKQEMLARASRRSNREE